MSTSAEQAIRETGIIAILRGRYSVEALAEIAEALRAGGVRVLEVTLNSPSALEGISSLRDCVAEDMIVGAGTVRTAEDVAAALDAGAQFLVAPNFDPASAARAHEHGVLHLPGISTATEAQNAYAAGCSLQKLFPAAELGASYLQALRGPLDDVDFVPTGGIDRDAIGPFVEAGAVAFGVGSALVGRTDSSRDEITRRASRLVRTFRAAVESRE